ncbi:hypothetical protein T492DRAFT_1055854, partial [Pavlovales sp. CCMP2436]
MLPEAWERASQAPLALPDTRDVPLRCVERYTSATNRRSWRGQRVQNWAQARQTRRAPRGLWKRASRTPLPPRLVGHAGSPLR